MKNILTFLTIVLLLTACKTDQEDVFQNETSEEVVQEETPQESTDTETDDQDVESVVTTYYLIRHAEKVTSDPSDQNPTLTAEGEARAIQWKEYFDDKDIEAVYSTNYIRTMNTAAPTAQANNLEIIDYSPSVLYDNAFAIATEGKNVVVVGHSNTTPNFANAILNTQEAPVIDESDYGNLYIVTVEGEQRTFSSQHFN